MDMRMDQSLGWYVHDDEKKNSCHFQKLNHANQTIASYFTYPIIPIFYIFVTFHMCCSTYSNFYNSLNFNISPITDVCNCTLHTKYGNNLQLTCNYNYSTATFAGLSASFNGSNKTVINTTDTDWLTAICSTSPHLLQL